MDEFGRPFWDDYFMSLAMLITTRSIDPRTKHGCVIVDSGHRILSTGYNGPIRGSIDANIPLDGESKYPFLEHAEKNSIYSSRVSLENSTAYVTGFPCNECFRGLIQSGITRVVYGPIGSVMLGETDGQEPSNMAVIKQMIVGKNIKLEKYSGDFWSVFDSMEKYLKTKNITRAEKKIESQLKLGWTIKETIGDAVANIAGTDRVNAKISKVKGHENDDCNCGGDGFKDVSDK